MAIATGGYGVELSNAQLYEGRGSSQEVAAALAVAGIAARDVGAGPHRSNLLNALVPD